jgi:hypothetical protein
MGLKENNLDIKCMVEFHEYINYGVAHNNHQFIRKICAVSTIPRFRLVSDDIINISDTNLASRGHKPFHVVVI